MNKKLISVNPSTGEELWNGFETTDENLSQIITKARNYQSIWNKTPFESRREIINQFAQLVKANAEEAATIISSENGKPFWEAKMEVNSLINKVQVVFDAYEERAKEKIKDLPNGRQSITRYRPHGVMAVLGPFNFPMSMPNSHIMPALYAGNTVVFKPSEKTPKSALYYTDLWYKAGLPQEVLQIALGDAEIGKKLISSQEINGILFIGSRAAGKQIEQIAIKHDKLCALEMGGNSPLVIWDYSDIRGAINVAIQSCYISSGQRCSAARRLIVNSAIAKEFIPSLSQAVDRIIVGNPFCENPVPFMGPLIDTKAACLFMNEYQNLVDKGATVLVPSKILSELGEAFVKPSLLDVTNTKCEDKEIFGPLLQIIIVNDIEEAVNVANSTEYGLAAGIVTESKEIYNYFFNNIHAGIVNWNQSLTGSTTIAPFGGIKGSGNFHPAGYLSVDYCVYGCASIESAVSKAPTSLSPGLDF